jgi:hypothetical protein
MLTRAMPLFSLMPPYAMSRYCRHASAIADAAIMFYGAPPLLRYSPFIMPAFFFSPAAMPFSLPFSPQFAASPLISPR